MKTIVRSLAQATTTTARAAVAAYATFAAMATLGLAPATALAWPDKPVKLVVPYAAGGGADGTARLLAQRLSTSLGQQVVVENRPGGGGVIGADTVAKAPADGHTLLFDASAFAVNPSLRKLPFDARRDFLPVSLVVVAPNILVVAPQSPYKTLAELVAAAKAAPGKLSFASAGNGSAAHLAGETLNDLAGVDLLHVPYKGGAPALNDVMGHQVSLYFGNTASTLGHVKAGKLRALAIGSPRRSATLPDLPTLQEAGLAGFVTQEWNGLFAPRGTPDEVVQRLAREVKAALADPELRGKLVQLGLEPVGQTPAEFAAFLQQDMQRAAEVVRVRGIKLD